jgi:hypothetical protein
MLQSLKQLFGSKLGASDGELGHVKNFYFDDQNWAVRYVIADTGNWLPGRQVLISPLAVGPIYDAGKLLPVHLTREQIEHSPLIELHQPVSRQYEQEYHRYYGWPDYWVGSGLWGGERGFPILDTPTLHHSGDAPAPTRSKSDPAEAHLRSVQAVTGYHLEATDGIVGHVCDFLLDAQSWAINQLVIKVGHRFTGKEVQIPVSRVTRISYDESKVYADLTMAAVEKSPEHRIVPNGIVMHQSDSTLSL